MEQQICPPELLEELRALEASAQHRENQARQLASEAQSFRDHASMRATQKLKLVKGQSVDLNTGAVISENKDPQA